MNKDYEVPLEENLKSWLRDPSDKAFIVTYGENMNVYFQGLKSGKMICVEAASPQYTESLNSEGIKKLQELGWILSTDGNFCQEFASIELPKLISLTEDTFSCYSVAPLQVNVGFELV